MKRDERAEGSPREIVAFGPSIGTYLGRDIPSYIVNRNGQRSDYSRAAVSENGRVDLDQLTKGECVIAPGLIYRRANPEAAE